MATKYSLWLIPSVQQREPLEQLIQHLAVQQHTPAFAAHMTLASGLVSMDAWPSYTQQLASTAPLLIPVEGVEGENTRFRYLYVRCALTAPLVALHQMTHQHFALSNPAHYRPHVSLLYRDGDEAQRKQIIETLPTTALRHPIQFDQVQLLETSGDVEAWRCVETYPLETRQ